MKLRVYVLEDQRLDLRPASVDRAWINAFPSDSRIVACP